MLLSFKQSIYCFGLGLALLAVHAAGAQSPMLGNWRESGGGVVHVGMCQRDLCFSIVALDANAPGTIDKNNPDVAKQSRPLCGLLIGTGFHLNDPTHAVEGTLYDPRSGKSYRGSATFKEGKLYLRGYVGITLLGRTEEWTRITGNFPKCDVLR